MSLAIAPPKGMTSDYGNLGIVYRTRRELVRAVEPGQRAVVLFADTGSPNAALAQG